MIEVNKRIYMNELSLENTEDFDRLKLDIDGMSILWM